MGNLAGPAVLRLPVGVRGDADDLGLEVHPVPLASQRLALAAAGLIRARVGSVGDDVNARVIRDAALPDGAAVDHGGDVVRAGEAGSGAAAGGTGVGVNARLRASAIQQRTRVREAAGREVES